MLGDVLIRCRVMDEMRQVLQEGQVDQRVQYIVEGLFKIQRDGFEKSGFPQIPEGLDLLEDADKITVNFDIASDVPEVQQGLNIFKADPLFEEHEKEYEVCIALTTLHSNDCVLMKETSFCPTGTRSFYLHPEPYVHLLHCLSFCVAQPLEAGCSSQKIQC